MTTQLDQVFALSDDGVPADSLVMADGSIWSHAATLGSYVKGRAFSIDKPTIDSLIRNFRKAPVDYEHGTVNGATDLGQPVPKAGDILELKGVYGADDFVGDLKSAAEKLAAKANRQLGDASNFGLWMRWRPTARALRMIKDGEYSELSIAFGHDHTNSRGERQGPTLYSVALVNLPFLDTMLPVAASRRDGGTPAASGSEDTSMPEKNSTSPLLLSAAAAIVGKAVQSEEEATTILTNAAPEIIRLRAFEAQVGAELGEIEVGKAVTRLKALKLENAELLSAKNAADKARIDSVIDATMKEFEDRLTPFVRDEIFAPRLRAELEKNPVLLAKDSKTVQALKELKPTGITKQSSSGDTGGTLSDDPDVKLDVLSQQHLSKDEDLIELKKTDPDRALDMAQDRAAKEIKYESPQMRRAREKATTA